MNEINFPVFPDFVSRFENSPLQEKDPIDKLENKNNEIIIFEEPKNYKFRVEGFKSGLEVINAYTSANINDQYVILFYEKLEKGKSNFFGQLVLIKFGKKFEERLRNIKKNSLSSKINTSNSISISSIRKFAEEIHKYLTTNYKDIDKEEIDVDRIEKIINNQLQINSLFSIIVSDFFELVNFIPEKLFGGLSDIVEKLKFKEADYTPAFAKENKTPLAYTKEQLNNLIPSHFLNKVVSFKKSFEDKITGYYGKKIPKSLRDFSNKIFKIIDSVLEFLPIFVSIVNEIIEIFFEFRAFLMGIINGLLGTIQMIFDLQKFIFTDQSYKVLTGESYVAINKVLEFIEDFFDLISEKFAEIKESFVTLGKDFSKEKLLKFFKQFFGDISRYDIAYFAGIVIFEIIIGAVLTVFTGGVGEVANAATKSQRFLQAFVKEIIPTLTLGLVDFIKLLRTFFTKFIQFAKKGWDGLTDFLKQLKSGKNLDEVEEFDDLLYNGKRLQKGAGNLNKSFFENAGIKIERFASESKVIGQTSDNTCVATSLRMVLEDKGILRAEEELARVLKTDSDGASILDIPEALYQKRLDEVITIVEKKINIQKLEKILEQGDKAIVSVWTEKLRGHAMILEKIENGKVFLRDPLPINKGASYKVNLEDFKEIFNKKAVIIKK